MPAPPAVWRKARLFMRQRCRLPGGRSDFVAELQERGGRAPVAPYSKVYHGGRFQRTAIVGSSQAAFEPEMRLGILALSLTFVMQGQAAQDDTKKELEKLQGKWAIATFNGQDVPAEAQFFLVFSGDKYEQWNSGSVDERGTIKVDPKTKPMSIDLIITEGNDAGKTQPGVYELTTHKFAIGLLFRETRRPTGGEAEHRCA